MTATVDDGAGVQLKNLVDGRWQDGRGEEFTSTNPSRPDSVVGAGALAGQAEVDEAVAAAARALPGWARTPHHERAAVLVRAAAAVEQSAEAWGYELAAEEGKTRAEGVGEVLRAAQILRYCAGEADREAGEMYSSPRRGERVLVTRRPLGVVGVITPFNFPIAIPAWKIAPALSHGNTVVWKPASLVPLLAMRLAQALQEAGLPPGVLNLLAGDGATGSRLVDHPGISGITFTGSTGVGRAIAASCAARGVPVQAEMGGKNPAVVLADADLGLAVEQVLLGAFRSTGQKCTATSRLIVEDGIAGEFLAEFARRTQSLVVGDAVDPATQMGPLVSASARATVHQGIEDAVGQGATPLAGASPYPGGDLAAGYFVPPTVLELPSTDLAVWREELFGPVVGVVRARDAQEAFALANDGEYGLSAAVFTNDLGRALESVVELDVGILHVNSETAGADPHVPFGGAKGSGYGPKEQGRASREFFTHTTTVYLRGGRPA
ncbi:aldehyde dehydrogenase family protein [Blastococcus xanthinilyticus]|uniref:Aldehyde dehydrogenase (NAD+) n=1 Tax=Blastococcus xanthinilyticus TaxID=1564164 RepID=A0A5S5CXZ2_9ACTN|nr:aldehyde dehydrogenase family protein [Blastococcus xanthinilyticus]TYP88593.1 aldehyde dehydrogenase (NAD+) [Blastococcus xanthinilyticus]